MLAAGISPGQLRKDHLLRVYVSYFDLNKVFQPRFLAGIAFTSHHQGEGPDRPEAIAANHSSLFLGLDCLRVGQYHQAEGFFIKESRQPRGQQLYATIGRGLVALEQSRFHDMDHYLGSALNSAIANKDRAYVFLLLYRHYRLQNDHWKAAHSLDNIHSFDRENTEVAYRQIQLAVAAGSSQETVTRIRALVANHKIYFMHVLLDPELLPIQETVENVLQSRLQNQRLEAEESLARARAVAAETAPWLKPEENDLRELGDDLALLEQQEQQQSYYDLIDIAAKAHQLSQRCYRLQEARIDALHERLATTGKRLAGCEAFWHRYPYQAFTPEFNQHLEDLRELTSRASHDGRKSLTGAGYRVLLDALEDSEDKFKRLRELTLRMAWVRNLFNAGKQFIRSLLVVEITLISLTLVLLTALLLLSADSPAASGLAEGLRDPTVQKRILTMVTLILAPLLALIHTLWRSMKP